MDKDLECEHSNDTRWDWAGPVRKIVASFDQFSPVLKINLESVYYIASELCSMVSTFGWGLFFTGNRRFAREKLRKGHVNHYLRSI